MKTKSIILANLFAFILFSCSSNEPLSDTTSVSSNDIILTAEVDATLDDITTIAEDQFSEQISITGKSSVLRKSILPDCATITTVLTNSTWTRTIDFGTDGCTLRNGNTVKGKIIISFINDFTALTHTISYTFEGFYHNGKLVEGNKSISRSKKSTELQSEIHPVINHSIDLTITFNDRTIYDIAGTRTKEMTEGFDTPLEWSDNVFMESGNNTITRRNGTVITTEITTPLRFEISCLSPFPVSGTKTITKNDSTATLDFGNGECDTLATLTKNGVTTEIDLRKK